jgi:hypothetical protein
MYVCMHATVDGPAYESVLVGRQFILLPLATLTVNTIHTNIHIILALLGYLWLQDTHKYTYIYSISYPWTVTYTHKYTYILAYWATLTVTYTQI